MEIRFMQEADTEAVRDLFLRLYQHLQKLGFIFQLNKDYLEDYLALQLKSKLSCIQVLVKDQEIVGFIGLSTSGVNRKFIWPGPKFYGIISELYIIEEHRGSGHARALLSAAEEYFKSLQITAVLVEALQQNHQAHILYQIAGFKHNYTSYLKRIEP